MPRRKDSDRVQIGLRLREGLRRKLESQAKDHAISINGEIESRLERSFTDEEARKEELRHEFGGPRSLALSQVIARIAKTLEVTPDHWWSDNPSVFKELRIAVNTLLDELEPPSVAVDDHSPKSVVSGHELALAFVSHFRHPCRWGDIDLSEVSPNFKISSESLENRIDHRVAYDAATQLRRLIDRKGRKQ